MSGRCGHCGTPLDDAGDRLCFCGERKSELEVVTQRAARLAANESPARDARAQGRWMKRVAAVRREEN